MSAIRQALLLRDATSQMVLGATIYFQDEQGILRLGFGGDIKEGIFTGATCAGTAQPHDSCCSHLIDEETEAQRTGESCRRTHSWLGQNLPAGLPGLM